METAPSFLAWHGTRSDGTTLHLKDKEPIGVKSIQEGEIVPGQNALHASEKPLDMLRFAGGLWIKRVVCEGTVVPHNDGLQIACSERTPLAEGNCREVILKWAFACADRAMRLHAVDALRLAGRPEDGDALAALPELKDALSAEQAIDVVEPMASIQSAARAVFAARAAVRASRASETGARAAIIACADAASQSAANPENEAEWQNAELEKRLLHHLDIEADTGSRSA